MVTRPTIYPKWADQDQVDPVSGQLNATEPPAQRADSGWARREIPPRQWMNWLHRWTYRWLLWFEQETDRNTAALNGNTSAPTPEVLMRRDSDGRVQAADPVDPQDVVTKNYLDPAGTSQLLATNGYTTLPSGVIIQWFEHDPGSLGNNSTFDVDFPLPFPNEVFQVILGGTSGNIPSNSATTEGMDVGSFTLTTVTVLSSWNSFPTNTGSSVVRFFAIGR